MNNQDTELDYLSVTEDSGLTRAGFLGFQNMEILVALMGLVGTASILFLLNLPGVNKFFILVVAPVPFCLCILFVILFMHNKPPHHFSDVIDGAIRQNQVQPFGKIHSLLPDGLVFKHVLIWNSLQNGQWSCGMELEIPAIDYSRNATKNAFMHRTTALLNTLAKSGLRIQLYWKIDSDYTKELYDYRKDTESLPEGICKTYRQIRYEQYRKLSNTRLLRKEKLFVFVSRELLKDEKITWNHSEEDYAEFEEAVKNDLENAALNIFDQIRGLLDSAGIAARPLDADDLIGLLRNHFNPSIALTPMLFEIQRNDGLSIREQTIFSDLTYCNEGGASFMMDEQYYTVFCLRLPLPRNLYQGIIRELTKLDGILDYEIVINAVPKDSKKLQEKLNREVQLLKNQQENKNASILLGFSEQAKIEMAEELFSERFVPLDVQYFIYVHGLNQDDLNIKNNAIKGALSRLGAGYYVLNNTMAAINAFFQGTPGWLHGSRTGHSFMTLDKYLAPLLPFSSTYTGLLDNAEAIYQGEQGNLIGLKQFAKAFSKESDPQHSLLFGKTGSGKSVMIADLLMQTIGFYAYTVIIDYGLSYKALAEKLGITPIYLGPSSSVTINYFDTMGLPLTGEHLSTVATILRVMADGLASDGMIMRYLKPFYLVTAKQWYEAHEEDTELIRELTAKAYLMDKYLQDRIVDDELEAYQLACREWKDYPFKEDELQSFTFRSKDQVYYQCFALIPKEDFPTHTKFVNYLRSNPLADDEADPRKLQEVTDALELWQRNGKNGRMFDGITNLDMSDPIQYFELSGIPANDKNFKFAAGALIQLISMRKIERMDRPPKKRMIVDEANSLFEIPQGIKMVENALTKFRKHRCAVLLSFQQYEMLDQAAVKSSITSNIHQYLLMGQSDRNDVDALAAALGLSGPIANAILNFVTPANLPAAQRYSAFAQVVKTKGMISGVGRNYMSPELLEMIGSK